MTSQTFELRRPVTPYVCSTPVDFNEEREYLRTHIFPKLDELCRSRGSYFGADDFLWKPGDSKTESGVLLKTQLDAIKKCSPFFIGILGETYGPHRNPNTPRLVKPRNGRGLPEGNSVDWLDRNFLMAAHGGHPWVLEDAHQSSSVTELEVTQANFLCDNQHATLYYRQLEHLEDKLGFLDGGDDEQNTPGEDCEAQRQEIIKRHSSESDYAKTKVRDLKQRLVNRGIPVKYFRTLEELGQHVMDDWVEIIEMMLPPLIHDSSLLQTPVYNEWIAQQSFVQSRTQVFVSTNEVEELLQDLSDFALTCTKADATLNAENIFPSSSNHERDNHGFLMTAWLKKRSSSPQSTVNTIPSMLLLGGDRGVGKSALISRWVNEFKSEYPHIFTKAHFVSASASSANLCSFMHECINDLRKQFILSEDYHSNKLCVEMERDSMSNFSSFSALCQAFTAALSLGPCVIVLDGLNELTSCLGLTVQEVKEFSWLPEAIPSCCKLILTTTKSDISHRSLSEREDVVFVSCPSSLTESITNVALVREYASDAGKLLRGEDKVRHLGSLRVMQSTLGSRVISNEILRPQVYQNFAMYMDQWTEIWSLRNFWTQCVQSWVQNHSWISDNTSSEIQFFDNGFDYSGWVSDSLCLIALSRNGLTQQQLLSILKTIGYEGDLEVKDYEWHQFFLSAGATLHKNADGRIVFSHSYLREVAEYFFFKSMSSVTHDPVSIQKSSKEGLRQSYHSHLARFFSQYSLGVQTMEELPWHLMLSGDVLGLIDFLTDSGVLLQMLDISNWEAWIQDLKLYWSVCRLSGHRADQTYLSMMHSMRVVDTLDMQRFELEQDGEVMWTPSPRIIISTPQPMNDTWEEREEKEDDNDDDNGADDEKDPNVKEATLSEQEEEDDDLDDTSFSEGIFVTQNGLTHSASMSRKSSGKLSRAEHFPTMTLLAWRVSQLLKALGYPKAHQCMVSSLVRYMKQNYSLTLSQHLLLSQCYHCLGVLMESSGQMETAEMEYRLALQSAMTADDMDDEMTHQTDILYLKGLLLCCHGNITLIKGDLFEAEELFKESLECVEDNPDCFVLRSNIHEHLGKLRALQHDFPRAEACLRQCAKLRSQWVGSSHPLVADVFVELASILTNKNSKSVDARQAESLYREALRIREETVGPCDLSVAAVLFELGELLAVEQSQLVKMEAQKLLRRSLDIRTTQLGTSHPQTTAVQQSLTHLDVALKLGHYEFGSAKPKEGRSPNSPFSAMSFRDKDLSRLKSRVQNSGASHSYQAPISIRSMSREEVMKHNRPDSIASMASERLLSATVGEKARPRLLSRGKDRHGFDSSRSSFMNLSEKENYDNAQDLVIVDGLDSKGRRLIVGENGCRKDEGDAKHVDSDDRLVDGGERDNSSDENGDVIDDAYIDSYAEVANPHQRVKDKKRVQMRPSSAPRKMFQRFQGVEIKTTPQQPSSSAGRKSANSARSRGQMWSGRSVASSSANSGHLSRCSVPGRYDISHSTARTISGPNSSLQALLGDPPCPRPPSGSVHHRSAWYHVPGRYPTPQSRYPHKRMQKTENAKDIEAFLALKTHWERKQLLKKRIAYEREQQQLQEQEKLQKELQKEEADAREFHALFGDEPPQIYNDTEQRTQNNFVSFKPGTRNNNSSAAKKAKPTGQWRVDNRNETPRLMISGLDKVPESRYNTDSLSNLTRPHGHGVKFKEPIVVG